MCGIVGVLSFSKMGVFKNDVDIFEDLCKIVTVRGVDGSGIFWVGDENTGLHDNKRPLASTLKVGNSFLHLQGDKAYDKARKNFEKSRFLIGHARAATRGDSSTKNAHPFVEGSIIMVHNGTIDISMKKDGKKFEVDSHSLCYDLSKNSAVDVLKELDGPTALVWYDSSENKLKIFRNSDRPLFWVEYFDRLFIASEDWMLEGALKRNHFQPKKPELFTAQTLFEFTHESSDPTVTNIPKKISVWQGAYRGRRIWDASSGCFIEDYNQDVWEERRPILPPAPVVNLPARYRKKHSSVDDETMRKLAQKFHESIKNRDKVKLIPTNEYFTLTPGNRVIFEPLNIEFLDEHKVRAMILGAFKDVLPRKPTPYAMLNTVKIYAKTHKKPKVMPSVLFDNAYLSGKVESIEINQDDMSDVRVNVVDVEPYSARFLAELEKSRQPITPRSV